jgi:hypothetical protein
VRLGFVQDVEGVAEGVGRGSVASARVGHEDLDGGYLFFFLLRGGVESGAAMGCMAG